MYVSTTIVQYKHMVKYNTQTSTEVKKKREEIDITSDMFQKLKVENVRSKYFKVLVINLLITFFYFVGISVLSGLGGGNAETENNIAISTLVLLSVYVTFLEFKLIAKNSEKWLLPTIALILFPIFSGIIQMLFFVVT